MKLGIDIDDTICDSIENMLPYICDFYNLDYEIEKAKCLPYDAYHILPDYEKFANLMYDKVMPYAKLKEKADYYINALSDFGCEIIFITARSEFGFKDAYDTSKNYLDKYGIHYDKLIIGAMEKGKICIEEGIDIFIDDNVKNCSDVYDVGIKTWLFDNPFNRNDNYFERVKDWEDVYNKIVNKKSQLDS